MNDIQPCAVVTRQRRRVTQGVYRVFGKIRCGEYALEPNSGIGCRAFGQHSDPTGLMCIRRRGLIPRTAAAWESQQTLASNRNCTMVLRHSTTTFDRHSLSGHPTQVSTAHA